MAVKKSIARKPGLNLPDIVPRKNPQGGHDARIYSKDPPLPIPPPGFITPSETAKSK